jgi:hypothetical protein
MEIADKKQLLDYLEKQHIFKPQNLSSLYVRYFGGGVSGVVALVSDGEKNIIVKQALAALKVANLWECDPSRMIIEHRALEVYARLVPNGVPRPICCDEKNHIMIREAAPESCPVWKEQLLGGLLDFGTARQAVDSLLTVHNKTAGDPLVRAAFENGEFFYALRMDPYIMRVAEKYPELKTEADALVHALMNSPIALIHGDYSPKNILVDGGRIYILDFEVAYYGHPAFDLAFFMNHFILKSIKNPQWAGAYWNMLWYMSSRYLQNITHGDPAEMEAQTVRTLAFLLLARIDGKSPAEYITGEADKQCARNIAFSMMRQKTNTFDKVFEIIDLHLRGGFKMSGFETGPRGKGGY